MSPAWTDVTVRELRDPDRCRALASVLSRVGDKWAMLVVISLKDGPVRFSELRRSIGAVSQRMLALTLRNLERDGLVTREVTSPSRVDYALTHLGQSLGQPVMALGGWASANREAVESARRTMASSAA